MPMASQLGGSGLQFANSGYAGGTAARQAAIDTFIRNWQFNIQLQEERIQKEKDRKAQKEAAKEQKKAQKKAQRRGALTMGIGAGAAIAGGAVLGAAMAPSAAAGAAAGEAGAAGAAGGAAAGEGAAAAGAGTVAGEMAAIEGGGFATATTAAGGGMLPGAVAANTGAALIPGATGVATVAPAGATVLGAGAGGAAGMTAGQGVLLGGSLGGLGAAGGLSGGLQAPSSTQQPSWTSSPGKSAATYGLLGGLGYLSGQNYVAPVMAAQQHAADQQLSQQRWGAEHGLAREGMGLRRAELGLRASDAEANRGIRMGEAMLGYDEAMTRNASRGGTGGGAGITPSSLYDTAYGSTSERLGGGWFDMEGKPSTPDVGEFRSGINPNAKWSARLMLSERGLPLSGQAQAIYGDWKQMNQDAGRNPILGDAAISELQRKAQARGGYGYEEEEFINFLVGRKRWEQLGGGTPLGASK